MIVQIDRDPSLTFWVDEVSVLKPLHGKSVNVPQEQYNRWKRVQTEWLVIQDEMEDAYHDKHRSS